MRPRVATGDLSAETLELAWRGIQRRRRRARTLRRAAQAASVLSVIAALLVLLLRPKPAGPRELALAGGGPLPSAWIAAAPETIALDDGSRIELGAGTRLSRVAAADASRVELGLASGVAVFDVRPGGPRGWLIDAGPAQVRVLGTRFTVEREGERVRVSVERGKVSVESAQIDGGARQLVAGQSIEVGPRIVEAPPALAPAPPPPVDGPAPAPRAVDAAGPGRRAPAPTSSERRHEPDPERDGEGAPSSPDAPPSSPQERLARADAARREGRPREAIELLSGVVDEGAPGAPLAAFTVGKLYADALGEAAVAAAWFERASVLGLPAGLDEEALARSVECHWRAGRSDEAARAAARYEARHPGGRHSARVKRWAAE